MVKFCVDGLQLFVVFLLLTFTIRGCPAVGESPSFRSWADFSHLVESFVGNWGSTIAFRVLVQMEERERREMLNLERNFGVQKMASYLLHTATT